MRRPPRGQRPRLELRPRSTSCHAPQVALSIGQCRDVLKGRTNRWVGKVQKGYKRYKLDADQTKVKARKANRNCVHYPGLVAEDADPPQPPILPCPRPPRSAPAATASASQSRRHISMPQRNKPNQRGRDCLERSSISRCSSHRSEEYDRRIRVARAL